MYITCREDHGKGEIDPESIMDLQYLSNGLRHYEKETALGPVWVRWILVCSCYYPQPDAPKSAMEFHLIESKQFFIADNEIPIYRKAFMKRKSILIMENPF